MKILESKFVFALVVSITVLLLYSVFWNSLAETRTHKLTSEFSQDLNEQSKENEIMNEETVEVTEKKATSNRKKQFREKCVRLFKKMRYPNKNLLFRPPLKLPPADLIFNFTDNGKMPIAKQWYINEAYSDSSDTHDQDKKITYTIPSADMLKLREIVRQRQPISVYSDLTMTKKLFAYKMEVSGRTLAVIGTQTPWIEAIACEVGVSRVTTLDYTRKKYDNSDGQLEWRHVNDYLEAVIEGKEQFESFDNIASFSSIEHSGLGRYGDPLSPFGDLEAVQQVWCMLKPGGLFFLGLPVSSDGSSYIEFNAHRVYGDYRLNMLFEGWAELERENGGSDHRVFVLRKPISSKADP
jgi:SAM-dependent methyltransferase